MKNNIILHNKNIIAYICLIFFFINVKTQMNCKTESIFFYYAQHGGHLASWRAECGPRVEDPGL